MASSSSHNKLLPLLVIMFFTIHPTLSSNTVPGIQQLIEKICRQMEEFGFCDRTFNEKLKSPSPDIADLTQITIEQAVMNATDRHDYILQLLKNTTTRAEKNALTACENGYNIVLQFFQNAYVAFVDGDYDSMMRYEHETPRAEASCEITFRAPPNPVNQLVDRNRQMRILIAMALVTGNILVTWSPRISISPVE